MRLHIRWWMLGILLAGFSTVCHESKGEFFFLKPEKVSVAAGEPLVIRWQALPVFSKKIFLVIAIPESAHVQNRVYAIPARSRAPFSIGLFQDSSRVIVPARSGTNENRLEITIHKAGAHNIKWAIVSQGALGDLPGSVTTLASGSFGIDVAYGSARFDADEQHPVGKAESTALGPGGGYLLRSYKDHYQVIDTRTGGLIASRVGKRAAFSPQGRYVLSRHGFAGLDLFDLQTGFAMEVASEESWPDYGTVDQVVWVNGDALLLLSHSRGGALTVAVPLTGFISPFPYVSCNACTGYGDTSIFIDLDNLVVGVDLLHMPGEPDQQFAFLDGEQRDESQPMNFDQTKFRDVISATGGKIDRFSWRSTDPFVFVPALVAQIDGQRDRSLVQQARARAIRLTGTSADVGVPQRTSTAFVSYREVQMGDERFSQDSVEATFLATVETHGLALRHAIHARKTSMPYQSAPRFEKISRLATRALLAEMPRGSPASKFIDELAPASRNEAFVSRGPTSLILGEEDMQEGRKDGDEPLRPLISERSLVEVSRLKANGNSIVLVQHLDSYGTSSAKYGDLVAVSIPEDGTAPRVLRLASHNSEDGELVEAEQAVQTQRSSGYAQANTAPTTTNVPGPSGVGRALGLAYRPELVVGLALPDRLLVTSRLTGATAIFAVPSLEALALVASQEDQGQLARVNLLRDKPYLFRMSALGSFSLQHISKPQLRAFGRYVSGELVLFDQHQRFEMTDEAGELVFVRLEGSPNLVPAEQFRAIKQPPGTIAGTLGAGGEIHGASLNAPPIVSVQLDKSDYVVHVSSGTDLRSIDMLVDGVLAAQVTLEGRTASKRFKRDIGGRGRWTTFVARDVKGVKSVPSFIEAPNSRYGGTLRVIALGVDGYRTPAVPDLRYAASDARRVTKAALEGLRKRYSSAESLIVDDRSALLASPELLTAEIRRQAEATGPDDVLLLFVSAHGLIGSTGLEIALPASSTGVLQRIQFSALASALNLARGRIFVFLDTCHAGGATHDAAIEQLTAINPTVAVIAASKGEQRSAEGPTWGGGVFSSAVVRALEASDRSTRKPFANTDDLFGNIRSYVLDQTEGRQLPMLRVTRSVGPFALH